jgi:glycosyltransferase involved in cell wall biosynthesis
MRIAIDARAWDWTGVGRYIRNLLGSLMAADAENHYIVLIGKKNAPSFERAAAGWVRQPKVQIVDDRYYSLAEQTIFWKQVEGIPADIFHFTHFNVPLAFSRPYIVTIHDVTRFIFPGQKQTGFWQQVAYEAVFARAVSKARAVICMSRTTEEELRHLPVKLPANVRTIYQGIDDIFFEPIAALNVQKIRMLVDTKQSYVLSVGVWMNHKNVERMLRAFAAVRQQRPELKLVITGRPKPGYINVVKMAQEMNIADSIIFPGFVPHRLLPALYASSAVFLFPSLYEGFGLPPLEAAACGAPVVAANVASIPEVMGSAALYVNPEDTADIARGILQVLGNKELAGRLVKQGHAQAEKFRWSTAAQQHGQVYNSL